MGSLIHLPDMTRAAAAAKARGVNRAMLTRDAIMTLVEQWTRIA